MMIISCPSCARRYLVNESVLVANQRISLRCAMCAHSWVHTSLPQGDPVKTSVEVSAPVKTTSEVAPAPSAVGDHPTTPTPPLGASSPAAVPPASATPPTLAPPFASALPITPPPPLGPSTEVLGDGEDYLERRRQRLSAQPLEKKGLKEAIFPEKKGLTFGWIAFLATLLMLVGVFVFGQESLIRFWPPFEKFYGIFGVKERPADRHALTLENVTAQIVEREGGKVLVIAGGVVNTSSKSARLSDLKVHVLSPCQEGMCPSQGRRLPISADRLLAGERIFFESPSLSVPPLGSQVVVEF